MTLFIRGFIFSLLIPWSLQAMTLSDFENRARERNPQLRAARQAWKVLDAQSGVAGAFPDPTFTYISEKFPSGMDGTAAESVQHYRVEQPLPFPGKLSKEKLMKHHEALIAETAYDELEREILTQVRQKVYQLALTDRSIALADQSVAVLKNALTSSQTRLSSGQSSTADVFMAQTELRRMENLAYEQHQARLLAQIDLNTLLNDPTDKSLDPLMPPPLQELPMDLAALQVLAVRHSPWIMNGHHEKLHSQAMIDRSRLEYAPNFGLMVERETAPAGPAGRQIGVSMTFPLWLERPWGTMKAAREHALETEAIVEDRTNLVHRMVHAEFIQFNTHLTKARRYQEGIVPSAENTLQVVRQQYASGQTDFLRFLEAFRSWLNARLEYEEEIYQYGHHWAELERWIGADILYDGGGAREKAGEGAKS